ncbi:MAG: hypothetical protein QXI09_01295 [Candidatus Aenigmatarchaeota archaeon]
MKNIRKNKKVLYFLILVFFVLFFIALYLFKISIEREEKYVLISPFGGINLTLEKERLGTTIKIDYSCNRDEDCFIASINCCPEDAGAQWECIGKNSIIICDVEGILCMKIKSPKPNFYCKCVNGFCIPQ